MGSRFFQRPENAISKAEEFINVGKLSINVFKFLLVHLHYQNYVLIANILSLSRQACAGIGYAL